MALQTNKHTFRVALLIKSSQLKIHTHKHTCAHFHIYTNKQCGSNTYIYTHTHTHTNSHTNSHTHTHTHTHIPPKRMTTSIYSKANINKTNL